MAGNSSRTRLGKVLGGVLGFVAATSPPIRALLEEVERRERERILAELAAERYVFCEHRGATMSIRAHARMHAKERKAAREG